jgi:hypothetical protein
MVLRDEMEHPDGAPRWIFPRYLFIDGAEDGYRTSYCSVVPVLCELVQCIGHA